MLAMLAQPVSHCGVAALYRPGLAVSADFTGDGVKDHAYIVRSRCGSYVEMVSRGRRFRVRVPTPASDTGPSVRRAANLDKRRGEDLLVSAARSGDTLTYRVVTFAAGRLRLMQMTPRSEPGFVLGHGSSHGEGFACLRPGMMEQIVWGNTPPTIGLRKVYVADGLSWKLVRTTRIRVPKDEFPSQVRSPFARCR
jgi:hypothetical protein